MPPALKHWRSFGPGEWQHVREGARGLLLGSVLPVLLFYVALRAASFAAAVIAVLAWSLAIFAWHRRQTGSGDVFSGVTFGFACFQALVGLVSQDPFLYLAIPSLENLVYGSAFLVSALVGRPLLALYARRLYPVPPAVQDSATFLRAFQVASLVWFVGLAFRGALRLWLLVTLPLEAYLVVNTVSGWPFSAALVIFSAWYPLRALRRAGLMLAPARIDQVEEAVEEAAPGIP